MNFTATLSITEAKRNAQELKRVLADLGINTVTQSQKIFNQSQIEFQNQLRKARIELLALKKEEQELKNTNLQTGAATAELTNKIAANRLAQQELTKAAKAAKEAQKATAGSYKEATERLKVLGAEIRNTTGGFNKMTPELKAKVREYNELNSRLKAFDETMGIHTRKVGNYKSALDGLKGVLSTYISVTAVLSGIKAVVNNNAELSDSLSDVRRTAGLTSIEADNLAEQLKKIDTRTSLKGLLDIAIIGGQLGIAKDQLAGFTTAVDQLAVSLGGELQGGAQGIAKSLGVLDNVFGITKSNAGDVEKSFNQIGSAILGLGQSGLATGDFLADFGERVGGLAKQAGLSLPVILSYGAVLQENGVSAEVAGSAFKRLLSALTVNRSKFFAVAQLADANLTLNDFTNIINTDAKKALDLFFAGLAKGGTTTSSFNDILKSLKLTGAGVSQAVAALANGQDALNGHIKDATNDFNEATLSAEQYAIKNDNLAGSIQKLGNTFDKITTSGSISRFFKAIVDGSNYALQAVDDLFNKITQNGRTNALKNYNRTGKTGSIFFSEEDAKFLQQEAKAAAQKGYVEGLNDQGRAFAKTLAERANGEKELNNTITAQTAKLNSLERERNKLLKNRADFNGILAVQEKQLLNQTSANYGRQKAVVQELLKTRDKLYPGAKPESPNVVIDNKSQLAEARKLENALKAQRALQAEIDALTKKGSDKRQDDDARELAEVDAKYKKLREKAIAFNNDSRNKAKGLRVDSSGLLRAQSDEEDALRDKQNASNLKTTIDKEKKYYEDFEKFKSDFGLEKARERYGKLINVDQTYLENLKAKQAALLGDDKAKGGDAGGGEFVAKQQKVLEDATAEALQEEQKRTDALLKEFMSYADKRKNLTEQYNADIKALEANPGAQAERKKRYEKDIKELDAANATQLESYEKLFEGIEKLSVKSALQLVKTARKQLADQIKSGTIVDPEQIKLINKLFDTTEQTIREKNGQALKDLAGEVNNVASEVGALNAEFGKVLGTVGSVIGKIGEIKGFKEILKKDSSSDAQRQIAGLGILGAGFSIFQSVIGFFTKSEQREQQASYARDLQNKQTEALNKALERQVALLNDVYGTDRIKDYSSAINQARENQAKYASELVGRYQLTGDSQLDEFITKLNNGEKIDPTYNGMVAKAKKASSLLPSDINTLQRLLDEGKLDANTATIVTNLIKAKETAEQLVNNLRAETVGTTLDQIADDFITTLTDGTQDFGKTFEQTIQKSILNGFKGELIRKQLQTFYTQFAALSEGGLTSDEIETLRKAYIEASAKAKKDIEDLSKATGIDLTSKGGSDNSSVGVIQKNVTESTATEWIGLIRAQYDNQKRQLDVLTPVGKTIGDMYQIAKSNFDVQVKIEANTYRTANNTDLLNTKLDNIERAIKGSGSTSYDRGK
ncbi:phage tail tape measure protein [Pedobacter sp. SG918]|uniref:phage tail tape measure protein n=1 Tax=Pedobacter sp. SG918 TaxID=2587136 RepID=UPI00146ECA5A|nr:phage tail tape measure protein [Pedobacter sp. SG918]NII81754.1 TP901 family phage tail tape measure protein [Pedobacter sp. SG908]NMN35756.1 TP901 family phage tail tape measure protein [Pedobacter sp. SG918]